MPRWVSRDAVAMPALQERESSCGQPARRWQLLPVPGVPGWGSHRCARSPAPGRAEDSSPRPAGFGGLWVKNRERERRKAEQGERVDFLSSLLGVGFFGNDQSFWVGTCSWRGQHPKCPRIHQPTVTMLSRVSFLIVFSELTVLNL